MKKVLLLAAVACAALSANAQALQKISNPNLWEKSAVYSVTNQVKAPAMKADIKAGDFIVGWFDDDTYDVDNGLGFNGDVSLEIGTEIPADFYAGLNGFKVDGVRFALCNSAQVKSVKLYGVTPDNYITEPLAVKEVNATCAKGWNYFEFAEGVTIDPSLVSLIPVYEFVNKSGAYAMGMRDLGNNGSFLAYGPLAQDGSMIWGDMGLDYGTPAIQMVCYADPVEGYNVKISNFESSTVGMGQTFEPEFTISSTSDKAVESIHYSLSFANEVIEGTETFKKAIPAGIGQKATFTKTLTAPQKAGSLPIVITIDAVNGEALAEPSVSTVYQDVVTKIVPRYHIVEEFTGTGCGFCPLGWAGMEYTKEHYSDKAGVVAIHQYNSTDPMYGTYYHTPDFAGAPSCRIDRFPEELNPYAENMGQYFQVLDQLIPEVDVKVWAAYTDENMTKVDAYASTEFLTDLDGSELVFVLTADGLTGTTSAWKQANYLYQYAASQYPASAKEFCKGGKYAQSSVTLVFNDVMIGSSWPSATKDNAVEPFPLTAAGYKVGTSYTLSLPTKTALKNALLKDQIYVTAMVIKADGMIANAARCRVLTQEEAAGVSSVTTEVENAALYDLQGRKVNAAAHGIFIQNGKKVIR